MRIVMGLFEGLLSYDPATLEPRPGLAYRYDVDSSNTLYTFHLRENAKWSNGQALTSSDVYNSWKRVLTPKTAAPYASQLYPILGAEAYNTGKNSDFNSVGIKVINPLTLQVQLHAPCPYFTSLCAFVTLFPTPIDLIKKYGDAWVKPEHIITSGPFIIKDWVSRNLITLEANPHYWDRACAFKTHQRVLIR